MRKAYYKNIILCPIDISEVDVVYRYIALL